MTTLARPKKLVLHLSELLQILRDRESLFPPVAVFIPPFVLVLSRWDSVERVLWEADLFNDAWDDMTLLKRDPTDILRDVLEWAF